MCSLKHNVDMFFGNNLYSSTIVIVLFILNSKDPIPLSKLFSNLPDLKVFQKRQPKRLLNKFVAVK